MSARAFYAPIDIANGRYTWPGFPKGGEDLSWGATSRNFAGEQFIKYMVTQSLVTQSPTVDWLQVDPTQYTSRLDQLVTMIDAVNPDQSRFKARGGKLMLWTGLNDWMITANNAT